VEPDGPARAAAVKVAFVHPDLGLGGAERLVVDAARELRAIASILPRRPARPGAAARPRAARRAPHLAVGDGAWRAAVGVPVARLGREGRWHVDAHFSRAAFGRRFEAALRTVLEGRCSAR